jgi:membrane protease YdiL (CAAX protease family)
MVGIIMIISAIIPFLFLSSSGRIIIGIKRPKSIKWLVIAGLLGVSASIILYFFGNILYQNSYENWYVYIGESYNIPDSISLKDKRILFLIVALSGMLFSPIGEELFFRGIVHSSFRKSLDEWKVIVIDCSFFALIHLAHFGIVYVNNQWHFFLIPSIIWTLSMFLVGFLFYEMRKMSDSIVGSIVCHSGFNLGMIYCIFYWL